MQTSSDMRSRHHQSVSPQEFSRLLEKRALAMSKKNNSLSLLDSAFCVYLNEYLAGHRERNSSPIRFTAKLTGIFVRALEDLAYPHTDPARKFIERYNQIGYQTFHEAWQPVKNIRFTHVDGVNHQLDFTHVVKSVARFIPNDQLQDSVDFAVLDAERKVLLLRFHRFLRSVWQNCGACEKEQNYKDGTLSGVFGNAKFTTYHLDQYIVFKFSDIGDEFYSFQLAISSDERAGYLAKIADCKIDLISALQMLEEVASNFDLSKYREEAPSDPDSPVQP